MIGLVCEWKVATNARGMAMSWSRDAMRRAGSDEAMYAVMAKVKEIIGDRVCGESCVQHEGESYRVSWSRLVCPSIW